MASLRDVMIAILIALVRVVSFVTTAMPAIVVHGWIYPPDFRRPLHNPLKEISDQALLATRK